MNDTWKNQEAVAHTDGYVDINLMVLLRYLVQSWRFILISVTVMLVMTTCQLRGASKSYEATMIVAPIEGDTGGSSGQSLTKVFTTLTSGSSGAGGLQFDEFQYKLTSPSVIHAANADGKLYTWLYGGAWDPKTRTFQKPTGVGQVLRGSVRRFLNRPEWYPQDDVLTALMLKEQIVISSIPRSSLTTISYVNEDPVIAAAVLRRLFGAADRELRTAQKARLRAQIENANEMMTATQLSNLREGMGQQLAAAQFRLMNLSENIGHSARNIEPPFVSPVPVSPKPMRSLAIVFVVTFFVSAFMIVGYRILRAQYDARDMEMPFLDAILQRLRVLWGRFRR